MKKIILFLLTFIVLIACNPQKEDKETIEIGVVIPLTGPAANHGKDLLEGINMAYKEIHHKIDTSKYDVQLIIEDDFSKPQGGVSALQKIIQLHDPLIVIGPIASSVMLAMVPIAEKNKTILFSPAASSPKLTNAGDYIFRMSLLAPDQTKLISDYTMNTLKIKKAGVLYINDDTGISYMQSFKNDFENNGGEIIFNVAYQKNDIDFRTQLSKLKNIDIEALFIPGVPRTVGIILRQAKELNLNLKFFGNYGAEGEDLITTANDATEGFIYTSIPISKDFARQYKKVNDKNPTIGPALGYDVMNIVFYLINIYGINKERVKEGLQNLENYKGATGTTSILPSGDASKEVVLKTIEGGDFVLLN